MFSAEVKMVDIDPQHWVNFTRLLSGELLPPRGGREKGGRPTLRLLVKDGRCVKAIHSEKGVLAGYQPEDLDPAAIARREGMGRVSVIEHGMPRRVMHRVQSRLSLDQNYLAQCFVILEAIKEELGGGIKAYPPLKLPDLTAGQAAFALKRVWPAGQLVVFVIYSSDGTIRDSSDLPIVTSGILRLNGRAEVDLWSTTDSLVGAGLTIHDWRTDYRLVNALTEKTWRSRIFFAAHLPFSVLPRLREASNLPRAVLELHRERAVILDPFPFRIQTLLRLGGLFGGRRG